MTASLDPLSKTLARIAGAVAALGLCLGLATVGPAAAEPALWKVSNGVSTAYLFGSVHLLRHEAVWDTPKVEAALDQSRELWLEITDVDNPQGMQGLVQTLGLDPGHPLSGKLDDAYRARLAAALASLGAPPNAYDALRPWLAALSLSTEPVKRAGYDPEAGVDRLLKQAAVKRGISVHGFETLPEQLHYLSDMTPAEELDMLHQALDEFDTTLKEVDEMEVAWEAGDDKTVSELVRKDMSEPLYQRLIAQRNKRFAAKLAERMRTPGVIFVAVGAGHLAGKDSVQAQLSQLGLKAVRQ